MICKQDMKRILISAVLGLLVMFAASAQSAPDWYPKADEAVATYINHEGEEEEIEVGATYDAPLTVTFIANRHYRFLSAVRVGNHTGQGWCGEASGQA